LNVVGALTAGSLSVSGSKSFDMPTTYKPGRRIRHRCVESPEARLIFEFQTDCVVGQNTIELPPYFQTLANTNVKCYVSASKCFGSGWAGTENGVSLHVHANLPGKYNIMVGGTPHGQSSYRRAQ